MFNYADPIKKATAEFSENIDKPGHLMESLNHKMSILEMYESLENTDNVVSDVSEIGTVLDFMRTNKDEFSSKIGNIKRAYADNKNEIIDFGGVMYSSRAMQLAIGQAVRDYLGESAVVDLLLSRISKKSNIKDKKRVIVVVGDAGSGKTTVSRMIENSGLFSEYILVADARSVSEINAPMAVLPSVAIVMDPDVNSSSEASRVKKGTKNSMEGVASSIVSGAVTVEPNTVIIRHSYNLTEKDLVAIKKIMLNESKRSILDLSTRKEKGILI